MTLRAAARIFLLGLVFLSFAVLPGGAAGRDSIRNVALSSPSFNPSGFETLRLTYELLGADRVTVQIWDPDGGLVRTLVEKASRPAGRHQETWDGRDSQGRPVPDEAYTFTVETVSGAVYDPTTFSGGTVGDLTEARFDPQAGTMVYRLPAASRVLVRLGVHSGPMLKTLVDWKPRVAGSISEYWNGHDESGLIRMHQNPGFTTLITYVTLPDATVIAYGNSKESYREYKLDRGKERPMRPKRPRQAALGSLRPENLVPPAWARAPKVSLVFTKVQEAVPTIRGEIDVRVDVDAADRDLLQRDQFEIIFFVDNVFFAEAERGHLPFNWRWELGQLPPGEHVLTVNIASFKGQVGVASRKIRIVEE
jgi:hypothetical protein